MTDIFSEENINSLQSGFASTSPGTKPEAIPAPSPNDIPPSTPVSAASIPPPPDPQTIASRMAGAGAAPSNVASETPGEAPPQASTNSTGIDIFDKEDISMPAQSADNAFTRGVTLPGPLNAVDNQHPEVTSYATQQQLQSQALAAKRFTPEQLTAFANNPVSISEAIQNQEEWPDVPALLDKQRMGEQLDDAQHRRLGEYIDTNLRSNVRGMSWNGNKALVGTQLPADAVSYVQQGQSGNVAEDVRTPVEPNLNGNTIMPAPYTPTVGETALNQFMAVTDKGKHLMASAGDSPASTALKIASAASVDDLPASLKSALYDAYKTRDPKASMSKVMTKDGMQKVIETLGEEKVAEIVKAEPNLHGGVLPFRTDAEGNTHFDLREGVTGFLFAPGDIYTGKVQAGSEEAKAEAANFGMSIVSGGFTSKATEMAADAILKGRGEVKSAGGVKAPTEAAATPVPMPEPTVDNYMDVLHPAKDQMMVDAGVVSVEGGKSKATAQAETILIENGIPEAQAQETVANMTANEKDQLVSQNQTPLESSYPSVSLEISPIQSFDKSYTSYDIHRDGSKVGYIQGKVDGEDFRISMASSEGKLTPSEWKNVIQQIRETYPNVKSISGKRVPLDRDRVDAREARITLNEQLASGVPVDGQSTDLAMGVADSQIKSLNAKEPPPINDAESGYNALTQRMNYLYRRLVNTLDPIEQAERLAIERGAEVPSGQSPKLLSNLYGNVSGLINHALSVETFTWAKDGSARVTGKALKSIMDDFDNVAKGVESSKDVRYKDFNDYLLAHRYAELEKAGEGKAKPQQVEWAGNRLKELANKYGDSLHLIENLSQEVYAFQRRTLDVLVDSGVVSGETRDLLNEKYPRYIPLDRVFAEDEVKATGEGKPKGKFSGAGPQGIIQKLRGSDREVREPLLNIYERTYKALDRAYRNKVALSIDGLKDVLPELIQKESPRMVKKGKADVKITHDPILDKKLDAAIEYFNHSAARQDKIKLKGFKGVLGLYSPMEKLIRTKLGANEAVKTHEVGHMLDFELGLGERMLKDPAIKKELQKLAEERIGGEVKTVKGAEGIEFLQERKKAGAKFIKYIKNDREVIANMFDAYVNAPEILDKIAPKSKAMFDEIIAEKPELSFINDIKPSLSREERTIQKDVWGEAEELPPNTIEVYKDGHRELLRVAKPMYEALTQLGPARVGMLEKILKGTFGTSARILRAGATSTIDFIMRNVMRDQMDALIQGGVGYNPPWDFTKGLMGAFGHTELYNAWERAGGKFEFMTLNDKGIEKAYHEMLHGEGRMMQVVKALPRVSEKFEQATRIGLYNAAKRKGLTDLEAGMASLEGTLNFGRSGDVIKKLNQYIPFLNAGVQGADKLIRTAYTHPKATLMLGIGTVTIPTVALTGYYLYGADQKTREKYLEIPQWQKDMYWVIIKDGEIQGAIPKPFSWGYTFGSVPERIMIWAYHGDKPEAKNMWADTVKGLAGSFSPVNDWSAVMPPMIKTVAEWQSNYNFFTGRNIYPPWMEDLPPEQRSNAYTSKTAQLAGQLIGQSPAKIENTIRGLTGGAGSYGLKAGDQIIDQFKRWNGETVAERPVSDVDNIFLKGLTIRDPIGSSSNSVQDFYENYKQSKQAHAGQKNIPEDEKDNYSETHQQQLSGYQSLENAHKSISKLQKEVSSIYNDKEMSGAEKKKVITELNQQITDVAREANNEYTAGAANVGAGEPAMKGTKP